MNVTKPSARGMISFFNHPHIHQTSTAVRKDMKL